MYHHFQALVQGLLVLALATSSTVTAAFGFTRSGNNFVIDAGSTDPLVFQVDTRSCDINSILYRGTQLQSDIKQRTHISSGLGSATVNASQLTGASSGKRYVRVSCATATLTHYLVVREGDSSIFMATHISKEPAIGELRFIARLNAKVLSGEYPFGEASATTPSTSTVEGSDVFVVGGQTRSKFYSSTRFMDRDAQCVYGGSINVCMVVPNMESSSGGPFFRDIESNNVGETTNLYNYMNSGHVQTEPFRMGLHGPYVMSFSGGGRRPNLNGTDLSFFDEIPDVKGYVPAKGRGFVSGTASGVPASFQAVVHWHNTEAQYWTVAGGGGSFKSPAMKPGTYTMVLYQTEYKVASVASVKVSAGKTTTADIASGFRPAAKANSLFKIGEYDGQPTGFRNADKFLRMHPSDRRMASWGPVNYTVGSSKPADFPMAQFAAVNNPTTIRFKLDSAPANGATLRIATTLSFANARPRATVNGWGGPSPPAPTRINSRGVTRGAYRGWGDVYDVKIPAGTLKAGENTITIGTLSGSSGGSFLSPNFIYDCVELFTS
ncbi:hypothetical protein MAPG_01584 [Magnaporthiopsis poae ATCC 64411]|uniref:Rhamnogalacturonate lyase n=1 Tax=Magnaporthiopsis poae (strain ATCC 64411 / 73-15) TaxID=644358 RepID=A0A0C4DP33_MAGP6|nr:hypothetical protein MAPG_01584 [Magnaporthiopsis poae ATCC 64411]